VQLYGLDSPGSAVAGSCEQDNEQNNNNKKRWEILEQLNEWLLLKDTALWS
jgi:hypothetical protein